MSNICMQFKIWYGVFQNEDFFLQMINVCILGYWDQQTYVALRSFPQFQCMRRNVKQPLKLLNCFYNKDDNHRSASDSASDRRKPDRI